MDERDVPPRYTAFSGLSSSFRILINRRQDGEAANYFDRFFAGKERKR